MGAAAGRQRACQCLAAPQSAPSAERSRARLPPAAHAHAPASVRSWSLAPCVIFSVGRPPALGWASGDITLTLHAPASSTAAIASQCSGAARR